MTRLAALAAYKFGRALTRWAEAMLAEHPDPHARALTALAGRRGGAR